MKTTIYGASDDLIEIDGAISEEVNTEKKKSFEFSDGTTGDIHYNDNGEWEIYVGQEGNLFDKLIKAVGDDKNHIDEDALGASPYSDVLVLGEGIDWVKIGNKTFSK